MTRIRLHRRLGTEIALGIAPRITGLAAEELSHRVKAKAAQRFPALAKHVRVEVKSVDVHHQVVMSVDGKAAPSGVVPDVASALEFGFVNTRSGKHVEGAHAMRDVDKGHLL